MKKIIKDVLKIYGVCTISAVVLSGAITAGVCLADGTITGSDVLDDTRYAPFGIPEKVQDIQDFLGGVADNVLDNSPASWAIDKFAESVAKNVVIETVDTAVDNNQTSITIDDSYAVMGKRRINYPYNNWYEVQYIYIYVNKNDYGQTPQQFGNYSVMPNTIFMVRQTNFDGVKAFSIPIAENGLVLQMGSAPSGAAVSIRLDGNNNNTFVYDDENGRQTVGFRHHGDRVNLINNSINTIVDNFLIDYYTNEQADYNSFLGSQRTFTNLEAFLGTGYAYNYSYGIMGGSPRPFYVTTAYFNTSGYDSDDAPIERINTFFNTDPNNVDPSKPPAYVMPQNNPLASGNTIDNSSINNYGDYGITLLNGELSLDPDILAGALGALIDPDFAGAVAGVFSAQPEIGLGFDTPLILDLPDLVADYIDSIIVYPPSEGWEPPSYPAITTYDIVVRPTFPTVSDSVPEYLPTVTADIYSVADRFLGPELLPIFIILALFGICISIIM